MSLKAQLYIAVTLPSVGMILVLQPTTNSFIAGLDLTTIKIPVNIVALNGNCLAYNYNLKLIEYEGAIAIIVLFSVSIKQLPLTE
mgnify:CR=1 FL=1